MEHEFGQHVEFRKIPRLLREVVVTEKIDGTNGQIAVELDGTVRAGSKNRWLTLDADNFGFARWVKEHEDVLREKLGVGRHHGEWWGPGIQRGYGLREKRFSLFNTSQWSGVQPPLYCVPVLWSGIFSTIMIEGALVDLRHCGSAASPGFMRPEGVVIYHVAGNVYFKQSLVDDEAPKGGRDGS